MTMALVVAHFVFEVPIRGSLALLYGLSAVFMWGTLGIGILVSAASRTVPQAMQLSFMTFLPSIYLSGLLFPIEGMPQGAQYIASIRSEHTSELQSPCNLVCRLLLEKKKKNLYTLIRDTGTE